MNFSLQKKDIYNYVQSVIALISVFWLLSLYELFASRSPESSVFSSILFKLISDFWSGLFIGILIFPIFIGIHSFRKKYAFIVVKVIFSFFVIVQFSLVKYSLTTMLNLGADALGYSFDDAFSTVSVSESISILYFLPFVIFPLLFFFLYVVYKKHLYDRLIIGIGVISILVFGSLKLIFSGTSDSRYQNKIAFLTTDIIKFQNEKRALNAFLYDREDYPLFKPLNKTNNVLSPFFESKAEKPNIVFVVIEGLGGEFVDGNTYSGFTPYFDSLTNKSLYWKNFISTTGRSFGILPSLLASLPYGEKGFLELTNTPSHLSLISILKANGYQTSYYSGGPSAFDRKINFLEYNGIDKLIDENNYGSGYEKTIGNDAGFSWGYPDSEIFKKALASFEVEKQPRLDIVITLSTHEPFQFPNKEAYIDKVDNVLSTLRKPEETKDIIVNNKDVFATLLYTDEALKTFLDGYSKRPDYDNTIFIITGDHRLIPIPQKDKLCRFHVPFLIYSPMLKKAETFNSLSSHLDVAPSLLNYLVNNHRFKPLEHVSWFGDGLDTAKAFRNIHKIPLMRYKGSINDYIYNDYMYSDGELFKINENLGTYKVKEEELSKTVSESLMAFKKLNAYVTQRNKIFPDSLNIYVTPKTEFSKEQLATIHELVDKKTFDEMLFLARDFAFNKQYKKALLICDYILNEYPNYTDVRILKGRTLAWQQEYMNAEEVLLNALKRSPYYDDAYLALLDLYWWSKQEEKSVEILSQALTNEVKNPEITFKMAQAYKRMANIASAEKLVDSILNEYPNNSDYTTFKAALK